jgi:hypothetical protein
MTFVIPLSIYFTTGRTFLANKYLQEESQWTISDKGIVIKGKTFSTQFDWNFIHKVKQINNVVIIYHDGVVASLIPFDAFKSYDDFEQFWKYIKDHNVRVG